MKKLTFTLTIIASLMGSLIIPMAVFAAGTSSTPQISLLGVQNIQKTSAAVTVSFDSNNISYEWQNEPKVSVSYIDPAGNTIVAGIVGESAGSRTITFSLNNLTAGTAYTYKATMLYGGTTYDTPTDTFTTLASSTNTTPVYTGPTGNPSFSLLGSAQVIGTSASVYVAYDSQSASYDWTSSPKISLSYTNVYTGQSYTTGTVSESIGSRTTTLSMNNLVKGSRYSYKAIMTYAGQRYETPDQTLDVPVPISSGSSFLGSSQSSQSSIPTGSPVITLLGAVNVSSVDAAVTASYDSQNANYEWSTEPKVSIAYTNLADGSTYTTIPVGESIGSRTITFTLRNLVANTNYSYQAVMTYAGQRAQTPAKTFKTLSSGTTLVPSTAVLTSPTATSSASISFISTPSAVAIAVGVNKVTSNLDSIVKTGGYGTDHGVSLSITDTHARVVNNDTFDYTIQYNNSNNKTLRGARIVVQLPNEYIYDSGGDSSTVYTNSSNVVTIYLGSIAPNESGLLTFKAKAIGTDNAAVATKATLYYTGGSVSATDT
jgi:hypothetical protein